MYLIITLIVLAGLLMLIYPNIKPKNPLIQDKNMIDMPSTTANAPRNEEKEVALEAGEKHEAPLIPIGPRKQNPQHLRHLEKKMLKGHVRNRMARKSRQINRKIS